MPIPGSKIQNIVALTPLQEGMLFHTLKEGREDLYVVQLSFTVEGPVERQAFLAAFDWVVARNESLRSTFRWQETRDPVRVVLADPPSAGRFLDLSGVAEARRQDVWREERRAVLDLGGRPVRLLLARLDDTSYRVLLTFHHILLDGWSSAVILRELFEAYAIAKTGGTPQATSKRDFQAFVKLLAERDREGEAAFWRRHLRGFEGATGVPAMPPSSDVSGGITRLDLSLGGEAQQAVQVAAAACGGTLASGLFAAWALVLNAYSNQDDVLFGTIVSGRPAKLEGVEEMVGLFINSLPFRVRIQKADTLRDLLVRCARRMQERSPFETTALTEIRKYCGQQTSDLFDTLVVLENYPRDEAALAANPELEIGSIESHEVTHYPLTLSFLPEEAKVRFSYDPQHFSAAAIERLSQHLRRALHLLAQNLNEPIATLSLLDPAEKEALVEECVNGLPERAVSVASSPEGAGGDSVDGTPDTETESLVLRCWEELLDKKDLGVEDTLFEAGGDSLLSIRLAQRLSTALGQVIPVAMLFEYPTIRTFARAIADAKTREEVLPETPRNVAQTTPAPAASSSGYEEIAVLGMAGRFPGAANIEEFWENLRSGKESITFFSKEELEEAGIPRATLELPGYIRAKGVLAEADCFDADLFRYSVEEARTMDPQLRVAHECVWAALEDAGYGWRDDALRVGVFFGATNNLHWLQQFAEGSRTPSEIFEVLALNDRDAFSTRLAFKLDLKGPVVNVLTACSTSLVAVHLACRSLMNGECDLAVAGGVSLTHPLVSGYLHQEGMVFSASGHCRAFDQSADGTVGGNGCGVVVLRRLEGALRERDPIRAVIKGSAINNDGALKVGYTAPGVDGQMGAIRAALAAAEVKPETVSFIECHGSGTPLGDPIELRALQGAFRKGEATAAQGTCAIGSVKTNIGHLDAAAGVAGLIKTVLALEHREMPPSLHFEEPNSEIDLDAGPFFVNTTLCPWPQSSTPRRAGVSSFGIGGSNAHLILEEAPSPTPDESGREAALLVLSAATEPALNRAMDNLAQALEQDPDLNLQDVAYTLGVGRRRLKHRAVLVADSGAEASQALTTRDVRQVRTAVVNQETSEIVFMFAGQGSEYVNIGVGLYRGEPIFRREADRSFQILEKLGVDAKGLLYPDDWEDHNITDDFSTCTFLSEECAELERVHAAIFVYEIALARLLISWGVRPKALIGYSFGELVAAHLAGVFGLEDALRLVVTRARLIQTTQAGRMLSVPLEAGEVGLKEGDGLSIAIDNGFSCVVAGGAGAVGFLQRDLQQRRVMCLELAAPFAIHSPLMEPIAEAFESEVARGELRPPRWPILSNVTGKVLTDAEATDPKYWVRHLKETVRFAAGVDQLFERFRDPVFVEIGAGSDLGAIAERQGNEGEAPSAKTLSTVRGGYTRVSDVRYLLAALGQLWGKGVAMDWKLLYGDQNRRRLHLPTYPFKRQRHLPDSTLTLEPTHRPGQPQIGEGLYEPLWKQAPSLLSTAAADLASQGPWLLFLDEAGWGLDLAMRLRTAGAQVITVGQGDSFVLGNPPAADEGVEAPEIHLPPEDEESYRELFLHLAQSGRLPGRIVHLFCVGNDDGDLAERIPAALRAGYFSVLYTVRATSTVALEGNCEFTIVTNGSQAAIDELVAYPEKAMVVAASKVIAQEVPGFRFRSIDLEPECTRSEPSAVALQGLYEELVHDQSEPLVVHRAGRRWIPFVAPTSLASASPGEGRQHGGLRRGGLYVILGGLGHLGLALAEHLAEKAQARIVLVGRSAFPERETWQNTDQLADPLRRKVERLLACEAAGGEVHLAQADISQVAQLRQVFEQTERSLGTIHGVFHAAGMSGQSTYCSIPDTDLAHTEAHFATKISGTLALDQVLAERKPDFCVLVSSLSPILGGVGFYAYAAANAFLDAFVHSGERAQHVPLKSVNLEGLVLAAEDASELPLGRGIEKFLISEARGARLLTELGMQPKSGRWIVASGDLEARIREWVETSTEESGSGEAISRGSRPAISTPYQAPQNQPERELVKVFENFFGFDTIGIDDNFFELGGDSLKAMSMVARIHRQMNVQVPLVELFNRPTVRALAHFITQAETTRFMSIEPAPSSSVGYALSTVQERLFVVSQIHSDSTLYNETGVFLIRGALDIPRLEDVVSRLIARHEIYRTVYQMVDGRLVQRILDMVDFEVEVHSLPDAATHGDGAGEADLIKDLIRPFDLGKAPLLRVMVLEGAPSTERSVLIVDMHHITTDRFSHHIFLEECIELYQGKSLPAPRVQYKDFAAWERERLSNGTLDDHARFWARQFEGEIPYLNLGHSGAALPMHRMTGGTLRFRVSAEEARLFKDADWGFEVTLFARLLAIFYVGLARWFGDEDIIIGTPVAGRGHPDLESMIGVFVNMLPLRNEPKGHKIFREFLEEVQVNSVRAFEHQDYPFGELVRGLKQKRDLSRNPLFDVAFGLDNIHMDELNIPGLQIEDYGFERKMTHFDLVLLAEEKDEGIDMAFEYSTAVLNHRAIESMAEAYVKMLEAVSRNPEILIEEIEIKSFQQAETTAVQETDYTNFAF